MNKILRKIDKALYNNFISGSIITVLGLVVISIFLSFFTTLKDGFKLIFGSIYVLFLPGFLLSYVFFDYKKHTIAFLQRVALSFALSISIVPLLVFYFNLIGIKIYSLSVSLIVLFICIISAIIIKVKNIFKKKSKGI